MHKSFFLLLFFILVPYINLYAQGTVSFPGTELLGRPTDSSITLNIIAGSPIDAYIRYGTESGVYSDNTGVTTKPANVPIEITINGLKANTRYYYRFVYSSDEGETWHERNERTFRTQRPPGSPFTFTMVADSHLGQYGGLDFREKSLYRQTLFNIRSDEPDFHIDLGDTFAMDPNPLGTGMTEDEGRAAYMVQRPFMGIISHSVPIYLVIGNHENEEGWNFDDIFDPPDQSLALISLKYRKLLYPNPVPDGFYSGNTDPLDEPIGGDYFREDYYAWEWGDALFVVLDPYHYSMTWPGPIYGYGGEGQDNETLGNQWDWTLGIEQYLWFKNTLEKSKARYKFVFAHHVTGGATAYGRGGESAVPYFEWGGKNLNGAWGFDIQRPASEGWVLPIHQMMVENNVTAFFHGHDHIYAREEVDGILYLECPKPDDAGYEWKPYGYGYTENLYPNAVQIKNSGHVRVKVSPANVIVDYVRSYLSGDGNNGEIADTYIIENPNKPPVADAGPDQGVIEGALITLNGKNSTDPDDGIATYKWELISGTPVDLSDPTSDSPTFAVHDCDSECVSLVFELTVNDNGGLPSTDTCIIKVYPEETQLMSLDADWSLISIYKETEKDINAVLSSVEGSYYSVWAYIDKKWRVFDPTNPAFSDLEKMEPGRGYWINTREQFQIGVSGADVSESVVLTTGWNLVGYNSPDQKTAADAMASITDNVISVWAYIDGRWKVYDPQNPGFSDLENMEPGYGYWINTSQDCTWSLE